METFIKDFDHFGSLFSQLWGQYVIRQYEDYYDLKKGDVVDGGACEGTFTVKAAKAVGDEGRVIAIEPNIDNLSLVERNIQANKLQNVIIVGKGLWSKKDNLRLYLGGSRGAHSFYGTKVANEFIEAEVDTLDNILRELGIKKVDFIKMDIEAAEIEALKGMEEALRNNVKLAIAAYHIVNGRRTYKTIAPQLKEKGFEVHVKEAIVYAQKRLG